jgi:hypothetical protein
MRLRTILACVAATLAVGASLAHRPAAPAQRSFSRDRHGEVAVRGVVHVHTGWSQDARGSLDHVARAARRAGLDFMIVTDHNTSASLGIDGYHHGVLVLGGTEKSTDAGHALALGLECMPFLLDGDPLTVVSDVGALGGFVVVAHPTSSHGEAAWRASLDGAGGIEIVNLGEPDVWPHLGPWLLGWLPRFLLDPQGALLSRLRFSRAAVALWDQALAERPIAGMLGADAHGGIRAGRFWVPVPTHLQIFRIASQHLLLPEPLDGSVAHDRRLVLEALHSGHDYLAFDGLADASGFHLEARSGGRRAGMGEALALEARAQAEIDAAVDAPTGTTLVLFRNGREVARGPSLHHVTAQAGTYRVEAYLPPALVPGDPALPWILSNPIDLYPEATLEARTARARFVPAEEPEAPAAVRVLDAFDGAALDRDWQVDRAPDAGGALHLEGGALRFDFALGSAAHTHASACLWRAQDLSSASALVFRVRADRPLRFDLQVRADEPGPPARMRIWRRSVRAEAGWRTAVVPFASLKTYDHGGGSPALGRVRGLYVHLDEAMLPRGSTGTLWIDDLGLAP